MILCSKRLQACALNLPKTIGTPKYLIGRALSLNFRIIVRFVPFGDTVALKLKTLFRICN